MLNRKSVALIKAQHQKKSLSYLQQAEKMLEFAANCGKKIDRNLIIVVLFNSACAYQGIWSLDKSEQYLDGAIYNIEQIIKDDINEINSYKSEGSQDGALFI